jgi:hypothetical protein
MDRPRCKACGRDDKFDFHVPDAIWVAVVPHHLVTRVVCLGCFDDFAAERGVEYARSLNGVFFAGDRAAFELRPVSAVTVSG